MPEIVDMDVAELGFPAGLHECVSDVPTMRSFEVRSIGASMRGLRRKQVFCIPKAWKVLQLHDGARWQGNNFGIVVFRDRNFQIREASIQMHFPPRPLKDFGFPHRGDRGQDYEATQLGITFAGRKQPLPLFESDKSGSFALPELRNGCNWVSVVLAVSDRVVENRVQHCAVGIDVRCRISAPFKVGKKRSDGGNFDIPGPD
ncbi:MAG TPA: hypothetical protein VI455_16895 [Terriglobia bacterium]